MEAEMRPITMERVEHPWREGATVVLLMAVLLALCWWVR